MQGSAGAAGKGAPERHRGASPEPVAAHTEIRCQQRGSGDGLRGKTEASSEKRRFGCSAPQEGTAGALRAHQGQADPASSTDRGRGALRITNRCVAPKQNCPRTASRFIWATCVLKANSYASRGCTQLRTAGCCTGIAPCAPVLSLPPQNNANNTTLPSRFTLKRLFT